MYSIENKDDEQLIWTRFLKGDIQVLSLVYLQHSNALFDYGCRFTGDRDLVKDCIQDVFCTLIRTRHHLSETDNIRLYLLKSIKRKLIRELKNIGNQPKSLNDQDYSFDLRWAENLEDQQHEIDEAKRDLIAEAMQSLTNRQKEAIYLRFNRGLEYEEISFILNLNYQSSRALIHRAIEKLRKVIHIPEKKTSHVLFAILCGGTKSVF
ncbi:MAG TPA: sigma-70 family RNA polymerase sigma factor [Prolixibacteraceae bacterium]|nr:sigma-70 family RNA polymerase sigma factor [Prolixibacteraceae bacterium]